MKCFIHSSIFLPAIHFLPLIHYYARLIMVKASLSYSDYQPKPYGKSMVRVTSCSAIKEGNSVFGELPSYLQQTVMWLR
jgi:hypothetical protein